MSDIVFFLQILSTFYQIYYCNTDVVKEQKLNVPKPDPDVASDYSDDFDESSQSEGDEGLSTLCT